jgi:hypothetical protein
MQNFESTVLFFKKENSAIILPVKWEVCEKRTFLSLCLAEGAIGI